MTVHVVSAAALARLFGADPEVERIESIRVTPDGRKVELRTAPTLTPEQAQHIAEIGAT